MRAALADAAELRQWFLTTATIDGCLGGAVDIGIHATGEILAWNPSRVLEHEWNVDPRPELTKGKRSVIRWKLASSGGGTLLTLTHRCLTKDTALGFALSPMRSSTSVVRMCDRF